MLKKRKGTKQNHPHQIEIDVILCRKKLRINFQPLVSLYANWLCAIDYMANVPFSLYLSRKAVNWYVTGEWFFTFLLAICGVCVCAWYLEFGFVCTAGYKLAERCRSDRKPKPEHMRNA